MTEMAGALDRIENGVNCNPAQYHDVKESTTAETTRGRTKCRQEQSW